jgi:hypothetical protein
MPIEGRWRPTITHYSCLWSSTRCSVLDPSTEAGNPRIALLHNVIMNLAVSARFGRSVEQV